MYPISAQFIFRQYFDKNFDKFNMFYQVNHNSKMHYGHEQDKNI